MPTNTSNYQEIIIPFLPALKKIQQSHKISQTEIVVLLIIKRANLNNKKITLRDILYILRYNYYTVNNIVHRLKKIGYITLNRNYHLTDQGEKTIRSLHVVMAREFTRINNYLGLTKSKTKSFQEAVYKYQRRQKKK
jgi:Mn-dependent DtxR family transcriptional regulator